MKLRTLITNVLGVLVIAGSATALSFVAISKPSLGWEKPTETVDSPKPEPTPAPAEVQTPAPQPVAETPAPTVEPQARTATTVSYVRLREGKSTSTTVLAELQGGTSVTLLPDVDSLWQQVQYGNLIGYIYKSYLSY